MKTQRGNAKFLNHLCLAVIVMAALFVGFSKTSFALDSDLSNGITVDSKLDSADSSIGDASCNDGSGRCTLRAAMEEANSVPGANTINFNILGTADFTFNTTGGYVIKPTTALPTISGPLTINGFSQPGSSENTTQFPYPMDTSLLIQISDAELDVGQTHLFSIEGADEVLIKGLNVPHVVLNDVTALIEVIDSTNISITGNYFGTNANALNSIYTGYFFNTDEVQAIRFTDSSDLIIGGSLPADRNIFAAVTNGIVFQSSDVNGDYTTHDITIKGNYFGVGADGLAHLGARDEASVLLTHVQNATIGGPEVEDGNMIENGWLHGVVVNESSQDFQIAGNRIVGNKGDGVNIDSSSMGTIGGDATNNSRNVIADNVQSGISINSSNTVDVLNNYIGTNQTGLLALGNHQNGILLEDTSQSSIYQNIVSGNDLSGVVLSGSSQNTIQSNKIGVGIDGSQSLPNGGEDAQHPAVSLSADAMNNRIGDTDELLANIIAHNNGAGVSIEGTGTVENSVLVNSIYNNAGLGVDLGNNGVTSNDVDDIDSGPNDSLNNPEISNVTESAGVTTVTFQLDVPGGDYVINFFANSSTYPNQGEVFIGSSSIHSDGAGIETFAADLSITGVESITAITSEDYGADNFGSSSEFSTQLNIHNPTDISVSQEIVNAPSSINTGDTLTYRLRLINNGPADLYLDDFSANFSAIFSILLPPDVTFVDALVPQDVSCVSYGPGSAVAAGSLLSEHSNYEMATCIYTGQGGILQVGGSLTVDARVTVSASHHTSFTSYLLSVPLPVDTDDREGFVTIYTSGGDLLSSQMFDSINNFTKTTYSVHAAAGSASGRASQKLSNTGQNVRQLFVLAVALITVSVIFRKGFRSRRKYSRRLNLKLPLIALVLSGTLVVLFSSQVFAYDAPAVVINEIMYHPQSGVDNDEFVELYNTTSSPIDLSGWCFTNGVTMCFTSGNFIPAHDYIVVSPNASRTLLTYGVTTLGTYTGKLDNGGERLVLKNNLSQTVADLTYDDVSPWPTSPDGTGPSLELRGPNDDFTQATSWAASIGSSSPGEINSITSLNPPNINSVSRPQNVQPSAQQSVTANVSNATSVELVYRTDFNGELTIAMYDDGLHNDDAPLDGKYGASIPGQTAGTLVRYKISAENGNGSAESPGNDDTVNYFGYAVQDSDTTSQIPIIQWFMDPGEYDDMVNNVQPYPHDNPKYPCVVVYGNQVFDSAEVHIKGQSTRFDTKHSFDFDLPKGHILNIPGSTDRDIHQFDINSDNAEASGALVPVAWEIARDMGMDTPNIFKTRVQQNGQFYGLYTFSEQYDETWREDKGYENFSFYKDNEKKTRLDESDTEVDDFVTSLMGGKSPARRTTALDNEGLPSFINYLAFITLIRANDWSTTKNMIMYKDIDRSDRWKVLPWDLDSAMGTEENFFPYVSLYDKISFADISSIYSRNDREPWSAFYDEVDLREMYFRRFRTVADKWYGGDNLMLTKYRQSLMKIEPERQLDAAMWPEYRANPDNAKKTIDDLIQKFETTFLVRYQLPWAVPEAQSTIPQAIIGEVSNNTSDQSYVKITNHSNESVDLSNWTISELNFTFEPGSVVLPDQEVYIVRNDRVFTGAHTGSLVLGSFNEDLDSILSSTLTLRRENGTISYTRSF